MTFLNLSHGAEIPDFGLSSFLQLRPAERSVGPFPVWELADGREWSFSNHWKAPSAELEPIGLHTVRDLMVSRPGVMRIDRFVGYDGATGREALDGLTEGERRACSAESNLIKIKGDVIVADGISSDIYGHWIVDYLPRFGVVRDLFPERIRDIPVLLPAGTRRWVYELLALSCGISQDQIISYTPGNDVVRCARALLPSYCYTKEFTFHSYVREFYGSFGTGPGSGKTAAKTRKILISRQNAGQSNRRFPHRHHFENMGLDFGYEIIRPEETSIPEQIRLFSEARVVVGEHGSGMHNAVFSGPGTVVGCLGFWNSVQLHIGYLMGHTNVYLTRGCGWPTAERNEFLLGMSVDDIHSFFEKIENITTAS